MCDLIFCADKGHLSGQVREGNYQAILDVGPQLVALHLQQQSRNLIYPSKLRIETWSRAGHSKDNVVYSHHLLLDANIMIIIKNTACAVIVQSEDVEACATIQSKLCTSANWSYSKMGKWRLIICSPLLLRRCQC